MKNFDPCPCRDDAQPHIWQGGECCLCGAYIKDHLKSNKADTRNREG